MTAALPLGALEMALRDRDIATGELIHHTDHGVQYACGDYIARLETAGIQPSMSRPGCPYDNAMAESFMKTLKAEEVVATLTRISNMPDRPSASSSKTSIIAVDSTPH